MTYSIKNVFRRVKKIEPDKVTVGVRDGESPEEEVFVPLDNKQIRLYNSTGEFELASVDEIVARKLNKFRGWKCSSGVRGIYIDYDGNVWTANCTGARHNVFNGVMFEKYNLQKEEEWGSDEHWEVMCDPVQKRQMLRNFSKEPGAWGRQIKRRQVKSPGKQAFFEGYLGNIYEGFDLPTSWVTCPYEYCSCGADVVLSKTKVENNLGPVGEQEDIEKSMPVSHKGIEGQIETMENHRETIDENLVVGLEQNHSIPFQVLWDLGRKCNYDCSYCWDASHNYKEKHKSYVDLLKTTDKIINIIGKRQGSGQIRFLFGGGEPTLHPNFTEWMQNLKGLGQFTQIVTNGSMPNKKWKECVKYLNSILMSAHFEEMNKDRFIENLITVLDWHDIDDDDHWIEVKLMTPPGNLNKVKRFANRINKLDRLEKPGANGRMKGCMSFVPIRDVDESDRLTEYTEEELWFFKQQ